MDRPITEAPQTHIYFITHGSGTFTVLRLRAVNAAELASLSIVDRTTAPRSTVIVASLILSRSTYLPAFTTEAAVECARGSGCVRKLFTLQILCSLHVPFGHEQQPLPEMSICELCHVSNLLYT